MIYLFYILKLALYHSIDIRLDLPRLTTILSGEKKNLWSIKVRTERLGVMKMLIQKSLEYEQLTWFTIKRLRLNLRGGCSKKIKIKSDWTKEIWHITGCLSESDLKRLLLWSQFENRELRQPKHYIQDLSLSKNTIYC